MTDCCESGMEVLFLKMVTGIGQYCGNLKDEKSVER
jgi:hypothetical protein